MNRQRFFGIFLSFLFLFTTIATEGSATYCFSDLPCYRHHIRIGPEFFHVQRTRKGGTKQEGYLYGVRASYDYIRRYCLYWGLETGYARGVLRGKTGFEDSVKSCFAEQFYEARLGYTLQSKSGCCAQLIPFVGVGYFIEKNDYVKPSPVHVHFRNTFYYTTMGALMRAFVTPRFSLGLNVKAMFSIDGRVKVTHDAEYESSCLKYENMIHCRATLPFCYSICLGRCEAELCFAPFYEYRHYGHHHNVPFDFFDTKIKNFGLDLFYIVKF